MASSGVGGPEKLPPPQTEKSKRFMSSDYESEPEPNYPMMPRAANLPTSASQQDLSYSVGSIPQYQGNMSDNTLRITVLSWIGFFCNVLGLMSAVVSFASPYWIQTYPHSFNEFRNLGLWNVCMRNYMHYKDDSQEVYNGCWWVFNPEKRFWKLRDWLLPPWMISVQVMVTGCLVVQLVAIVLAVCVFLHLCPAYHHKYHQTFSLFAAAAFNLLVAVTTIVAATVFGVMSQAWDWMPRPDMNFLSWGFGFFIIAGIFCVAAGVAYMLDAIKSFKEIMMDEEEYNTMLAMQAAEQEKAMSTYSAYSYDPYNTTASYGYPASEKSYDTKQSYASQPTFGTGYDHTYSQSDYDKGYPESGYNQSYPSGPEGYDKQQYPPQGGYDPQYAGQGYGGYDQGGYDPQQGYAPQVGYAPQQGYDAQQGYGQQQGYDPQAYSGGYTQSKQI